MPDALTVLLAGGLQISHTTTADELLVLLAGLRKSHSMERGLTHRSSHLPIEIWQQIAGHLTNRAWARICRTCRAMQSVQPIKINLTVNTASAMAWVQKHWGNARSMTLTWGHQDVPWIVAYNAASLSFLVRLQLVLGEVTSPTSAMLLTWLLGQAPALQILSMEQQSVLVLPPMQNLRHLVLTSDVFSETLVASIRQMRNLKTLSLASKADAAICEGLNLSELVNLSDVAVSSVVMSGAVFPRQCRVHLTGDEDVILLDRWAPLARTLQLGSIDLQDKRQIQSSMEIPAVLCMSHCTSLRWHTSGGLGFFRSPVRLELGFRRLSCLNLKGVILHIHIPSWMRLQLLHLSAHELSLSCNSPRDLVRSLRELSVLYKNLQGCDLFDVVAAMAASGIVPAPHKWPDQFYPLQGFHGFLCSSLSGRWECQCGACLDCLRTVG